MVLIIVVLPDLVSFINVERFLEKDYDILKKKLYMSAIEQQR